MNDFSSSSFFARIIRYWWFLVSLMIAGGLIGLSLTFFFRPVYESKAVITSALDYAVLGRIDDWEEDQIYRAIGDRIDSTEVKDEVMVQAKAAGILLTEANLEESFSIDRQDTRWVMRVRSNDPETARQLAEYWSSAAIASLKEMMDQGKTSLVMQQTMNSLAECFEQAVVQNPVSASCTVDNLDRIRAEMEKAAGDPELMDYRTSLMLSHTSFELTTEATSPSNPVLRSRNLMVLAGALIGLCLGLVLFSNGWPKIKEAA